MFAKSCWSVLLLSVFFLMTLFSTPSAHAERWALLVAVNDYRSISPDLRYCESDAIRMRNALIKYADFEAKNIKMLLGTQATKRNVKQAFKTWLIDNVKPGDTALFYFSGHGVQLSNPKAIEEEDRHDELLCVYDSARHAYTFIRDNELGRWIDNINTDRKIALFDCCHSGTATRSVMGFGEQTDNVPRIKAYYPEPGAGIRESTIDEIKASDPDVTEAELATLLGTSTRRVNADAGGEVSISGCADHQVSMESPREQGGVLTNYLIESMRSNDQTDTNGDGVVTVRELWKETQKRIRKAGWPQDPQYLTHAAHEVALIGTFNNGTEVSPADANLPKPELKPEVAAPAGTDYDGMVSQVSGRDIVLSIGSDDGVTAGSVYAVYDLEGNSKAEINITSVKPTTARARVIGDSKPIGVGDGVSEKRHFVESDDLLLLVESLKAEDRSARMTADRLTLRIKQKVARLPYVRLVDEREAPDRILAGTVKSVGGAFGVSLRVINVNIGNATPEHTLRMRADQIDVAVKTFFADHQIRTKTGELKRFEGFASIIRASYVLKALIKLENPKQKFKINATLNKGDLATYRIGELVEISMQPTRSCFVYVLDIGSSGKINLLFPSEFEPKNFLRKGQKYTIPSVGAGYEIPVGGPPGEERVKVIATTQKLPLNQLRPDNLGGAIRTYGTTAPELLQTSMKALSLRPRHTWATETVMFTVGDLDVYQEKSPVVLSIVGE